MPNSSNFRTIEDLERVIRAIAREFQTGTVFIVGSQAILMSWPEAPPDMRGTPEIDAYPENAALWEQRESQSGEPAAEASEHINALFGEGSMFHATHGFYIDGVDQFTASLPNGWRARATVRRFDVDGRSIDAVAPSPHDLIVSKLARLEEKDKQFVAAYHRERPLDVGSIEGLIQETELDRAVAARAVAFLRTLDQG